MAAIQLTTSVATFVAMLHSMTLFGVSVDATVQSMLLLVNAVVAIQSLLHHYATVAITFVLLTFACSM